MKKYFILLLVIAFSAQTLLAQNTCADLMRAIKQNNILQVETLIKPGDVNCVDKKSDPRTPLLLATRKGASDIAILLINAGADVNYHHSGDESPLMAATASGMSEVVDLMITKGANVKEEVRGDGTPSVSYTHLTLPTKA